MRESEMFNYSNRVEQLKKLQAELQEEVQRDIEATKMFLEAPERMQNMDTYDGWKHRGVSVRKGETAHKIGGQNLFHFTQTTGFGI